MTYPEFLEEWKSEDSHIMCHTSGSTGAPKDIRLDKSFLRESARRTLDFFKIRGKECRLHSAISPDYIGGKMMAVRSEVAGCTLTWEEPSNTPLIGIRGVIDLLAVVPSQMIYILDKIDRLPQIKNIIIGGAPIPEVLRIRIAESGLSAWETYGMTETASHIALRKVDTKEHTFTPLPGITISLSKSCALVIRMPDGTIVTTNDIAEIDATNNFTIRGRLDNVIISGGKKVHPEEIEKIIEKELGTPALITSEPDEKWGERVVLILEESGIEVEEITLRLKDILPKEAVPKKIVIGKITRTENGKKKRK